MNQNYFDNVINFLLVCISNIFTRYMRLSKNLYKRLYAVTRYIPQKILLPFSMYTR